MKRENNVFAIRLKDYMETNRWTKAELSRRSNLSKPTVFGYVNGTREPSATAITNICRALGVSSDYLLGLTDEVSK